MADDRDPGRIDVTPGQEQVDGAADFEGFGHDGRLIVRQVGRIDGPGELSLNQDGDDTLPREGDGVREELGPVAGGGAVFQPVEDDDPGMGRGGRSGGGPTGRFDDVGRDDGAWDRMGCVDGAAAGRL